MLSIYITIFMEQQHEEDPMWGPFGTSLGRGLQGNGPRGG